MRHELRLTDSLISTVAGGSPAIQALSLAYVKQHIKALGTYDDALVSVWIDAAASYFEEQTGRQLLTATREAWIDAFPSLGSSGVYARIEVPRPPLQSIVSVSYLDANGVRQNFTGGSPIAPLYSVTAPVGPYAARGYVEPLFGGTWPIPRRQTGSVRIQYLCGYGSTSAAIPPLIRGILCYLVAHFDTFRAAVHEARRGQVLEMPYGVQAMLDGFKYSAMPTQVLHDYNWPEYTDGIYAGRWIV